MAKIIQRSNSLIGLAKDYEIYVVSRDDSSRAKRRFNTIKNVYKHAIHMPGTTMMSAAKIVRTSGQTAMYWLMTDDIEINERLDLHWRPEKWDRKYPHFWRTSTVSGSSTDVFSGVWLMPREYEITDKEEKLGYTDSVKEILDFTNILIPYDVFFISYGEVNADENWENLLKSCPQAKRVDGVDGIHNAHRRCAELSDTEMFWTIDADSLLIDEFDLSWSPPIYDRQYLHVWHAINPVNDLSYGYGAVKLWPASSIADFQGSWLDFTTSVGKIKIIEEVASITKFNTDMFSSWKSGFREAVKLSMQARLIDDNQSLDRLVTWLNKTNPVSYARDTVWGARDGLQYYLDNKNDPQALKMINDFSWLRTTYMSITKSSFLGLDLTHNTVGKLLGRPDV
jgi:hypothetical protein